MKSKIFIPVFMFGIPSAFYCYYISWFSAIYFSGLGPSRIDEIGKFWKILWVYNPYWIPVIGFFFFPAILKIYKSWWVRILILGAYLVLVWNLSQASLMMLELFKHS